VLLLLWASWCRWMIGATPAFRQFGISYVWTEVWNPVKDHYGAMAPLYGPFTDSRLPSRHS